MHEYVTEEKFLTLIAKEHIYTSTNLFQENKRILWLLWVTKIWSESHYVTLSLVYFCAFHDCVYIALVENDTWDF